MFIVCTSIVWHCVLVWPLCVPSAQRKFCNGERIATWIMVWQALLQNLDDTSSSEDVLECLAACPQLCSEERRSLAEEMEPIITPVRKWLLKLEAEAAPLRSSSRCPSAPKPMTGKTARKGKAKGSNKAKGGGGGGGDDGSRDGAASQQTAAEEVEEEFFSRGRRGEGNRRNTRANPELSQVVAHNLVVLLGALHRAPVDVGDLDGVGVTGAASGGAEVATGAEGIEGNNADSCRLAAVAGGQLAREQDVVFGLAEPLLDACLNVAARRASPQLFGTVVEAKAMLRRRLWSSDDSLALDRQQAEADVDLDAAVPKIKVWDT